MNDSLPQSGQGPVQISVQPQTVPLPPPNQQQTWLTKLQTLIKQNKTGAIFLGCCILFALGTTIYYLVSPAKAPTMFLPAQQEIQPTPFIAQESSATPLPPTPTLFAVTNTPMPTFPPLPTATPTPDPQTEWTLYPNTVFGYSVRYPPTWTVVSLGQLEPLVPNYVVFNPNTATSSARSITISVSNRTYEDQLLINNANQQPITAGGIKGTLQNLQDSDGNTWLSVTLPQKNNLLLLNADTDYKVIFNLMLSTLQITN